MSQSKNVSLSQYNRLTIQKDNEKGLEALQAFKSKEKNGSKE